MDGAISVSGVQILAALTGAGGIIAFLYKALQSSYDKRVAQVEKQLEAAEEKNTELLKLLLAGTLSLKENNQALSALVEKAAK